MGCRGSGLCMQKRRRSRTPRRPHCVRPVSSRVGDRHLVWGVGFQGSGVGFFGGMHVEEAELVPVNTPRDPEVVRRGLETNTWFGV